MKRGDMTLEKDDAELDQLLARGRLSGAQYDLVESRVLARTVSGPIGRGIAFAADFAAALLRHARGSRSRNG